jgi:hypothetical protein
MKSSRVEAKVYCCHSPYQSIGRQFPLSQRERAGVRENHSNDNAVPDSQRRERESLERQYSLGSRNIPLQRFNTSTLQRTCPSRI